MSTRTADPFDRASSLEVGGTLLADSKASSPLESAISVEFDTGSLPAAQANAQRFVDLIKETLGAELGNELRMFLFQNKVDLDSLTLKQLDSRIPLRIIFHDGFIEYELKGKRQYVQLSFIMLGAVGDIIKVGAYGTTEDAERALGKVCECIFTAAGMSQQWADVKSSLIARGYATSSAELLDGSLDKILSKALADIVEAKLCATKDVVSKIGVLPLDQSTGEPYERDYQGVVKLGQLRLDVIRFDPISGDRYETTIAIHPKTKGVADKGRYVVASELEYSEHQELVKALKKALGA